MRKTTPLPSQQELQEWFDYRDGNLYRKKKTQNVKVGNKAGCVETNRSGKQYVRVRFKVKLYLIHRLIWAWHGNSLEPNEDIDHIDGDGLNNRIENLRAVTPKQNSENTKSARKDSKSGVKGVCWHKGTKKWEAHLGHNGKKIHLGCYKDIDEARAARIAAEKEYFTHAPDRDNEVVIEKPSGILSFI
jgi:hypothetical protein